MKRFFSHYTFLYPVLFLRNVVVELDDSNRLLAYYPFQEEVRNTEFYSGLLLFSVAEVHLNLTLIKYYWEQHELEKIASMADEKMDLSVLQHNSLAMFHLE